MKQYNVMHFTMFVLMVARIVTAAGPATAPDIGKLDQPPANYDSAIRVQLDKPIGSVQFNESSLSDALDFLRDMSKINISVNWKAINAAGVEKTNTVSMSLRNVKFSKTLQIVLEQAGDGKLGYAIDHDVVVISTKEDLDKSTDRKGGGVIAVSATTAPALSKEDQLVQAALDKRLPSVKFNQIPLSDGIDFLRDVTGTNIVVNWKAMKSADVDRTTTVSANLKNLRFSTILKVILDQAGDGRLGYTFDEGVMAISTNDDLERSGHSHPIANPAGRAIDSALKDENESVQAALDRALPTVQFNMVALSDAIDFLNDVTQANIVVNWKELKTARVDKFTTQISLSLRHTKLSGILKSILDQAGNGKLDYVIDQGVITISTKDDLDPSPKLIVLTDPRPVGTSDADAQQLVERTRGTALKLNPPDGSLIAKEVTPGHLTLTGQKISKGLGTISEIQIGDLWIENGRLKLRWIQSVPAAMDAFSYSTVEVQDVNGRRVKLYYFMSPVASSLSLNQNESATLAVPISVAAKATLAIPAPPSEWKVTTGGDGALVLTKGDVVGTIKYDPGVPDVILKWNSEKAPLDSLNEQYTNDQNQLNSLQAKEFRGTVASRAQYTDQINSLAKKMEMLRESITAMQALNGLVIELTLPNGIDAARITLQGGK